jgi:cell division protein FtsQ
MKKEKQKRKKKHKKKHYLLKTIVLILVGVGLYFLLTSELFTIRELTVKSNRYYTAEQVIEIAQAKTGGNLFEISTSEMKENLLNDPYIKDALVSRRLPDEIVFTITERQEAAAIPYGDRYIIIDADGSVLRQTDVEPTLTLLTGMTLSNIEPGTLISVEENSLLRDTLEMLDSMEKSEIFFKRIEISSIVVKAYIYDNLTCEGTPENILKNMDDLKDVLYDLYVKGIERGVIQVGGEGYYSFSPLVE